MRQKAVEKEIVFVPVSSFTVVEDIRTIDDKHIKNYFLEIWLKDGGLLPVKINQYSAMCITLGINKNKNFNRPLIHDLIVELLNRLEMRVDCVLVYDVENNIYKAKLRVVSKDRKIDFECRLSDGLAIVSRYDHCPPIYISSDIVCKYALYGESAITYLMPIEILKKELEEAVKREDYENAIKLRDWIKRKEENQKNIKNSDDSIDDDSVAV